VTPATVTRDDGKPAPDCFVFIFPVEGAPFLTQTTTTEEDRQRILAGLSAEWLELLAQAVALMSGDAVEEIDRERLAKELDE
jgi:hypothetical protein